MIKFSVPIGSLVGLALAGVVLIEYENQVLWGVVFLTFVAGILSIRPAPPVGIGAFSACFASFLVAVVRASATQ